MRATSNADSAKSAAVTVTVAAAGIVVLVSPTTETLQVGTSEQFDAAVTGTPTTAVTWSVDEGSVGGSVGAAGLYTAPGAAGTFHVRATSVAETSKSAAATVLVTTGLPPVIVTVTPGDVSLQTGVQQQFNAAVAGATNTSVTWTIDENACGTVSSTGLYTAPGNISPHSSIDCHVRTTSVADPTASGVGLAEVLTR